MPTALLPLMSPWNGTENVSDGKGVKDLSCQCGAVGCDGKFETGNGRSEHSFWCNVWTYERTPNDDGEGNKVV